MIIALLFFLWAHQKCKHPSYGPSVANTQAAAPYVALIILCGHLWNPHFIKKSGRSPKILLIVLFISTFCRLCRGLLLVFTACAIFIPFLFWRINYKQACMSKEITDKFVEGHVLHSCYNTCSPFCCITSVANGLCLNRCKNSNPASRTSRPALLLRPLTCLKGRG